MVADNHDDKQRGLCCMADVFTLQYIRLIVLLHSMSDVRSFMQFFASYGTEVQALLRIAKSVSLT